MSSGVLVYYFAFPHYRKEILSELRGILGQEIQFVSGSSNRGDIAGLSEEDVNGLARFRTKRIGPFTWDCGIVKMAISRDRHTVIVGPALSSLSTWAILTARKLFGRRTYLWGQCGRPGDKSLRRIVQEVMNRLASGLLVYGRAEADAAQELGTKRSKVHIVNNATKSQIEFLSSPYEKSILLDFESRLAQTKANGELSLLYVGRLSSAKKIHVLLEAARILRDTYPRVTVDIVGGGAEFESLVEKFQDPEFRFHGWVYDDLTLADLYKNATFAVSPYHMGLFAVDALRYGIPVLVPNNPMNASEVEALTEGTNSFRFPAGDPVQLARNIPLAFEKLSSIKGQSFVEARRKNLRRWDPYTVASNIVEVIG